MQIYFLIFFRIVYQNTFYFSLKYPREKATFPRKMASVAVYSKLSEGFFPPHLIFTGAIGAITPDLDFFIFINLHVYPFTRFIRYTRGNLPCIVIFLLGIRHFRLRPFDGQICMRSGRQSQRSILLRRFLRIHLFYNSGFRRLRNRGFYGGLAFRFSAAGVFFSLLGSSKYQTPHITNKTIAASSIFFKPVHTPLLDLPLKYLDSLYIPPPLRAKKANQLYF